MSQETGKRIMLIVLFVIISIIFSFQVAIPGSAALAKLNAVFQLHN